MTYTEQVRERMGGETYSNGWLLSDFNHSRKYGYQDAEALLKTELVRRYRSTTRDSFRRKAGIALAKSTSAEHVSTCSFQVLDMTEPCDCGGLEAALGVPK